MLILSRGPDQSIIINNNIRVMIVDNDGYNVKLGIDAPEEVPVHREEIQRLIKRQENKDNSLFLNNDGFEKNNGFGSSRPYVKNKFNRRKVCSTKSRRYYNNY
jgi:carbon storage regulator